MSWGSQLRWKLYNRMKTEISSVLKVESKNAPAAAGPYSQAIIAGDFVFCSGQIGTDPELNVLVDGGVLSEAKQVIENLENVLIEAGSGLNRVVKVEIFVTDISMFSEINRVYAGFFNTHPLPARVTVEVSALPKGAAIEISCVALLNKS